MEIIPAVAGNKTNINNAEFVKITVYNDVSNTANVTVHTFSSSYKEETIDGTVYSPLGGLVGVGVQQRDIRVTSADTSITISGIDGDNMAIVLGTKIRGSLMEITRGFYDDEFNLTSYAHRFTGIITSYNIVEERHDLVDSYTITLNSSSYKSVLENRISNRKTNVKSWQQFNPTDSSMNNVYSIADQAFDFGNPVSKSVTTFSTVTVTASVSSTNLGSTESR
jgi:hypothetical protein